MTSNKKKTPDMFDTDHSILSALSRAKERMKKAEDKEAKLNPHAVRIQEIQSYYDELGIRANPNSKLTLPVGEYPELFNIKLSKKQTDDMMCVTPGLETPPNTRFYVSLLTASIKEKTAAVNKTKKELTQPKQNTDIEEQSFDILDVRNDEDDKNDN